MQFWQKQEEYQCQFYQVNVLPYFRLKIDSLTSLMKYNCYYIKIYIFQVKVSNLVLLQFAGKFSLLLPLKVRRKLRRTWGSYGNSTYMYSCLIWTWLNSSNVHVFAEHHFIKHQVMWCCMLHPIWQIYKRWWPSACYTEINYIQPSKSSLPPTTTILTNHSSLLSFSSLYTHGFYFTTRARRTLKRK